MEDRFADTGSELRDFATHFVAHCPKCQGKAHISPQGRLTCTACFHVELPGRWYGAATAVVQVKCRECHAPISRTGPWDERWKKLAVRCERCGDNCEYEASITKHPYRDGKKTDPVFGLPLWLQAEFRGEALWAYNYEHLAELKQYIGARLRERGIEPRNTIKKNSAMASRLPAFIKKASNREDLLKCIDSLEKKSG